MDSKRAVILAGGKGTRLKPYTISLPKPLVPVGDIPVMEIIIRQLKNHGFKHITLAVNHMSEIIKAYFGDGSKWDVMIDYSEEKVALGTMGPLKIIDDLPEDFLVMNGDVITDLNFSELFKLHKSSDAFFTISTYSRKEKIDYGVIEELDGRLVEMKEKPSIDFQVSMGVYVVKKEVLPFIPENIPYGFDQLMSDLLSNDRNVQTVKHDKYWLDIGRPSDYEVALQDFDSNIKYFLE
ncbi:sugar phosphate nucleotidyltransferase [Gammaproteobacteria bacterium]|nr:sugar phosphate nucleotidyltransferase [Gammaproteobacteria bacterium]